MSRYDLTIDFKWRMMLPLLPSKPRGVPRVDDRRLLNRISGFYDQVPHGVIYQKDMVRTQRAIIDAGLSHLGIRHCMEPKEGRRKGPVLVIRVLSREERATFNDRLLPLEGRQGLKRLQPSLAQTATDSGRK